MSEQSSAAAVDVAVIYHSVTGNVYELAEAAAKAAEHAGGEVRVRKARELRQFIDTTGPLWAQGQLADKVVAASPPPPRSMAGRRPR